MPEDDKNVVDAIQPENSSFFEKLFKVDQDIVQRVKLINVDPNETGFDRIRESWDCFHKGKPSLEIEMIVNAFSIAAMTGFAIGGLTGKDQTFKNYVRKFNDNVYRGQFQANRSISDHMYLDFFKLGSRYALRSGLFSATFITPLILMATYRNDIYYRDGALSGLVTATLWKAHLGTRALLVNGVVGSLFGLTFSFLTRICMNLLDTSVHEMRHYHKKLDF